MHKWDADITPKPEISNVSILNAFVALTGNSMNNNLNTHTGQQAAEGWPCHPPLDKSEPNQISVKHLVCCGAKTDIFYCKKYYYLDCKTVQLTRQIFLCSHLIHCK